jgi:hypothetical protein
MSILEANLSNRVHFNETCMNKWISMSISIHVTSRLLPGMICGQWQEWKTEWNWKNENKKLAKLKTRKGGLGKNEHPADWQPMKAIQAKMGQWKESLLPGESKTRKGGSGKNGVWKWKMKEWNIEKALTTDANIQCLPSTDTPSNGDLYPRTFQGSLLYKFYCPQPWFWYVSQRRSLQRGFPLWICCSTSHYVPNLPMSCPSLWNFLCPTASQSCISSIHTCIIIHSMCSYIQ